MRLGSSGKIHFSALRKGAVVRAWVVWCLAVVAPAWGKPVASQNYEECYRAMAMADYVAADACARALSIDAATVQLRIEALEWRVDAPAEALADLRRVLEARPSAALVSHLDFADASLRQDNVRAKELAQAELARANGTKDMLAIAEAQIILAEALTAARERESAAAAIIAAEKSWHARKGLHARWHEFTMLMRGGALLAQDGRFEEANARYGAASALASAAFGEDSAPRVEADMMRAYQHEQLGQLREELALAEELLQRAYRGVGALTTLTAKAEAAVGEAFGQLGEHAAARPHFEAAERILEHAPNVSWRQRAIVLNNFANSLQESGDLDAALQRQRKVLEIAGERPEAQRMRAVVLSNTGNTEFSLGRYTEAQEHFQAAFALREKIESPNSPGLSFALEGMASTALVQSQFAEAERQFKRAFALREPGLNAEHPILAKIRFGIALARWGQGDTESAFKQTVDIARSEQRVLTHLATEFIERHSVSFREQLMPATALAVTLAARRGDADSLAIAWELTMRERGLIARTEARRIAAARAAAEPALQEKWQAWQKANAAYAEAWAGKSDAAALERLRHTAETAEQQLWDSLGISADETDSLPTPTQLARALPSHARLLALAGGLDANPSLALKAGRSTEPDDWYSFVLDATSKLQLVRLGRVDAISADARAWYAALRDPTSDRNALQQRGETLRRELLDPLRGTARQLFVVPQGDLFRLNLAALPQGDQFLVENGTDVHTLAHESDLLLPSSASAKGGVLLAGAPDFPAATAAPVQRQLCLRAPEQGFVRLASAERELDDLQRLFGAESVTALRGGDATRERVLQALPNARVAHFATHGFSLDDSCAEHPTRAITLETAKGGGSAQNLLSANPLSGLAFSGARVGGGVKPLGVLSAADLAALDLSHTDWVALSACDSGLGPIGRDEGVFGMRRALRLAGARTVVMSLWEVDDAATAQLMQQLYRARFSEHRDVPAAMGEAMRATLAARRKAGESDHPYYWAAFVGEGGWR